MPKTIVFCADGTWKGPGDKSEDRVSNVYKLYQWLQGVDVNHPDGGPGLERREKKLTGTAGVEQLAMYCHGVGSNKLQPGMKFIGGTVGGGLTTRLRLGYSYISSNYERDDSIVIVGFSRGSYTARALADMIATQGLLRPSEDAKHHGPFSHAAVAWCLYREKQVAARGSATPDLRQRIINMSRHVHEGFLKAFDQRLTDADFVAADVAAVAVWDTVGSMGIPAFVRGKKTLLDEFEFDSKVLHPKIGRAFHAVSLDEQRENFEPTLWEPDEQRLKQELFAGGHADVGGGYDDHGLSDVPLKWMIEQLTDIGMKFVDSVAMEHDGLSPDPLGMAHQAWLKMPYSKLGREVRKFPKDYVTVNESVWLRRNGGPVFSDPSLPPAPYDPPYLR